MIINAIQYNTMPYIGLPINFLTILLVFLHSPRVVNLNYHFFKRLIVVIDNATYKKQDLNEMSLILQFCYWLNNRFNLQYDLLEVSLNLGWFVLHSLGCSTKSDKTY